MSLVDPATHPRLRGIWLFIRHQLVSIVTTVVDFGVMILLCSGLGLLQPVPATTVGATVGAITNFLIGRSWTFQATHAPAAGQALRYAAVAVASLGLNTVGEHFFAEILSLQYVVARVITAVLVSAGWNYPMQRYVVFRQSTHKAT